MTVWHWVRHGPTHEKSFVGWRDVPADLSDHQRIARVREALPASALMVSSDLRRARDTAHALRAGGHTLLPEEPDLREINFGVWDGMRFDAVAARDPVLSREFWEQPGDIQAPDGESWNQTRTRVDAVVDRMNAQHPEAEITAVAHFGVILTQVQRALGVTAYEAMAHKIDNISITTVAHEMGVWDVRRINHIP